MLNVSVLSRNSVYAAAPTTAATTTTTTTATTTTATTTTTTTTTTTITTYLDKDVFGGAGNGVKVADLGTKSCWHSPIHLPAGLRETFSNAHVLSRETVASCQCQRASKIAD